MKLWIGCSSSDKNILSDTIVLLKHVEVEKIKSLEESDVCSALSYLKDIKDRKAFYQNFFVDNKFHLELTINKNKLINGWKEKVVQSDFGNIPIKDKPTIVFGKRYNCSLTTWFANFRPDKKIVNSSFIVQPLFPELLLKEIKSTGKFFCLSCGTSDYSTQDDIYICLYCGHKVRLKPI